MDIYKLRYLRLLLIVLIYGVVLASSLWLAYWLRFDFVIPPDQRQQIFRHLLFIVSFQLVALLVIGQFAGLLSYFSIPDLRLLFYGLAVPLCGLLGLWHFSFSEHLPPRSILLLDFILAFGGLSACRLTFRLIRERHRSVQGQLQKASIRVGIIGAGDAGAALIRELISKPGLGMQPVAIFDDDCNKWQSRVHTVPVVGPPETITAIQAKLRLDEIVIAMPSAPAKRIREIVSFLQQLKLRFKTVPSFDQLATGKVSVTQLRPVEIQDLLGREPIQLERRNIEQCLSDQVVMVTGAGGSIGSELCRQIVQFHPRRVLLVDQSEVQLFQIEQELIELGKGNIIHPIVADIVDCSRMEHIFKRFRPSVIFHAAAHKHVPMMECQPGEAIQNNTLGTVHLAQLAMEFEVERFVLISTDKAINPTSVMGATKRLAELFVQALHASNPEGTKFMAVRFGNVLGSSGSVVPIFKRQIAAGGPVKVTHPQMTRYFMTIPEAASLVLQSGALGVGGEIFVLDMGKPVKVADLAKQLIELSGYKPGEIEIQYVGLRPGEKLFEELQHEAENLAPTHHPKILRFTAAPMSLEDIQEHIRKLMDGLHSMDANHLKLLIKQAVPEYNPHLLTNGEIVASTRTVSMTIKSPGQEKRRPVSARFPMIASWNHPEHERKGENAPAESLTV
ncbi:polysaccharide biosynthesis protein [Pedosphaera parvula]|uniref:Polysaccharide biosynthesis protein CapD n=1 Tax=Pedosphaera parvula (strain Ellin514) TaxID=320771 RepID=B9XAW9_PEDPL|nr:nucleoside-diphosphate sugar epimerase/dehydratase [Pedosphaera parvula]EEF63154.1 polysaccharide biosynthesis protein CapD [Pedosphaera parvula Ellin514]